MTEYEICLRLADPETFNKTPEEIGRMDPWWIRNVLFYPRDKNGNFLPSRPAQEIAEARAEEPSQKENFWTRYRSRGWPESEIQKRWDSGLRR